jgi:hypothetical protein
MYARSRTALNWYYTQITVVEILCGMHEIYNSSYNLTSEIHTSSKEEKELHLACGNGQTYYFDTISLMHSTDVPNTSNRKNMNNV